MTITREILMMIIPLLLLQIGLIGTALYQLFKHGCKNLSQGIWIIVIIFVNTIGPILFLLLGRGENDSDY